MTDCARYVCHETDRERWLDERRKSLGSSDAPRVLGLIGSSLKVAALKQGLKVPDEEDELRRWGHYVEAPMLEAFADETGWKVKRSGELWRSTAADTDFMSATLDGLAWNPAGKVGGVECKFTLFKTGDWDEGVPDYVVAQVQHTMAVMGWEFIVVIVLLDGYRLRWKVIERQPELIGDVIVPEEREFWRCLSAGEPVPIRGDGDETSDALRAFYPEDNGQEIRLLGSDWIKTYDRWLVAREQRLQIQKAEKALANELKAAIGPHTFARFDDGRRVALTTTHRAGYPVAATSFRVLREAKPR